MIDWFKSLFKKEKCFVCDKILTRKDKQKGGCGFSGGLNGRKSFSYCEECSKSMVIDIFSGKKSRIQKIIESKLKNSQPQNPTGGEDEK